MAKNGLKITKSNKPCNKPKSDLPPNVFIDRHGKWRVRLYIPTDERYPDGRIKYIQPSAECEPRTEERAAQLTKELAAAVKCEINTTGGPQTLRELCEAVLEDKQNSVKPRTFEYYSQIYGRIKNDPLLDLTADTINPLTIRQFYQRIGRRMPADYVRRVHIFISLVFNQAINWDIVAKNPTKKANLPRKEKRISRKYLSPAESAKLAQASIGDSNLLIFALALETGMRPEEYAALTWDDIDLTNRTADVNKAVIWLRSGVLIESTKTERSHRKIDLSPTMVSAIKAHKKSFNQKLNDLAEGIAKPLTLSRVGRKPTTHTAKKKRAAHRSICRKRLAALIENNLVFPSREGSHQGLTAIRKRFHALLDRLGITKINLYALRHTCATLMIYEKAPLKAVAEKLGHVDERMVLSVYGHVLPETNAITLKAVESRLYE